MKFFPDIRIFKHKNEAWRIGGRVALLRSVAVIAAGLLSASALPPWNWSMAPWFGLIPLFWVLYTCRELSGAFYAWLWAAVYGFTGYYWLYEIHPVLPYVIAPVFGLYFIPFGFLVPFLYRYWHADAKLLLAGSQQVAAAPPMKGWREIGLTFGVAALFVLTEYLRHLVLPWNNLSVTQWRNLGLIGVCAVTGTYGISFLLVLINAAFALTLLEVRRCRNRYRRSYALLSAIVLLMGAFAINLLVTRPSAKAITRSFDVGVIQPNSERRHIGMDEASRSRMDLEALNVNIQLSQQLLAKRPRLILWPETSITVPLYFNSPFARLYRTEIYNTFGKEGIPLLLGTADWEDLPPDSSQRPMLTNTAYLVEAEAGKLKILGRYDKTHLVPFGEYVPFRKWLPGLISDQIEMGQDMKPGNTWEPLTLAPGFRMGISICFEDIFPYISRRQVQRGAEFLVVITNDSWYPESSEQAQHLANSVFRAVETGVPMIRCGSNSGSVLIHPDGKIESLNNLDPTQAARSAGTFKLTLPTEYRPTIFVRFGDYFVGICGILAGGALLVAVGSWLKIRNLIRRQEQNHD